MPRQIVVAIEILVSGIVGYLAQSLVWAGICMLVLLVLFVLFGVKRVRDFFGLPGGADGDSRPADVERIGYIGRQGSTANLSQARFGEGLDTGIDNSGDVDASRADFK